MRPGGRIILEDDGHDTLRLWPEPPGFVRLWQAYLRTYDRVGNDPVVGHRDRPSAAQCCHSDLPRLSGTRKKYMLVYIVLWTPHELHERSVRPVEAHSA